MTELTIKDIRDEFKRLKDSNTYTYVSGAKTVEIINANFIVQPNENAIFGEVNEYADREIEWYKGCSLNVKDIPGTCPAIWKRVATSEGWINSNYGWCIFHPSNGFQYKHCLQHLLDDQTTRQACMIYTRPSMQVDWNAEGMHDFMCTFATHQFIRNNTLHYIVLMRSNDAVYGFKNDLHWHKYVAYKLIDDLKANWIELSPDPIIHWQADSLHVYERHFSMIDETIIIK